jgi:hypothetical protein
MGTSGYDLGKQAAQERLQQQNQIQAQQRLQKQNTVGAQLLDAINQSSNIKPQIKDPNTGELIDNPAYAQAQEDRRQLLSQYAALNSPEQHATFAQHLHGLIFGKPSQHEQQPLLSTNSSPNAPIPDANAAPTAAPTPTPAAPLHPMASAPPEHPLHAITHGIKALGEHLKAAANPLPEQPQPDINLMSKYYRDPADVAFERQKELWGVRGENALAVAQERTKALMASLANRPPRMLSQTTIPNLLDQLKVDPDEVIYGPNGQEITPEQLAEMPPGTIARQFKAGPNIFYALGDQNSKTLNVNGMVYSIPAVGPVNLSGENANATPLGQATSTLPKNSVSQDQYGNVTTSQHTTAVPAPVSNAAPQVPTSAPQAPANPLAAVNASIAQGNAASSKLNKGKPVSANAPTGPPPPLDSNGHIPESYGNAQVREFANQLLDGVDKDKIPAKARAAASQMARQFGWEQGAFTPREKIQFQVATDFLKQLQGTDSLKVLDNYISREKIARAMKDPSKMNFIDRIAAYNLDPKEAEFLRLYNAALGTVQGLASITRSGRPTEAAVTRLKVELPNVLQSASSDDAKKRIDQLLKEASTALVTNPSQVGKGPVSANAPRVGEWKPPADAPAAPSTDNKVLKDASGTVIAKSQGGKWVQP